MTNTTKVNKIKPSQHGVAVTLDPSFLVNHALYLPDGKTVHKSNMTLGQAIEAIAYAHICAKFPQYADRCKHARIKFENGKFVVDFADSLDPLTF